MLFSRFNKLARYAFVVFLLREHHEHGGRGRFLSSAPIYLQPSAPFFIAFFLLRSPPRRLPVRASPAPAPPPPALAALAHAGGAPLECGAAVLKGAEGEGAGREMGASG